MPDAAFFEVQDRRAALDAPPDSEPTGVRFALSGIHHPTSPATVGWPVMTLTLESDLGPMALSTASPVLTLQGDGSYSPRFRKKYPTTRRSGVYQEPIDFVFDPTRVIEVAQRGQLVAEFEGLTIKFSDDDTAALVAFSRAIVTGTPSP